MSRSHSERSGAEDGPTPTVLYLHQYFRTPQMGGSTRSYEMARRLVADGYRVVLITSDTGDGPGVEFTNVDGIEVYWIRVSYDNTMSYPRRCLAFVAFSIKSTLASLKHEPDIVFATSTPLTICLPAVAVKLRRAVPFVFEVRDLWPELPIAMGALRNRWLIRASKALERFAYRQADAVVTLSPGMTRGVIESSTPPRKVTEIPNSCDIDEFAVAPEVGQSLRERHEWLGERPMLLYAGTLGRINGVGWLARVAAEALERNPEVRFVVIGTGQEHAAVSELAARLGVLGVNFFMIDQIPKSDIPRWFSAASAGCSLFIPLPEMENNSANKFFDTLAAGKPVLINYGGWQKTMIEQEGAGFAVDPHDHAAAARAIADILTDRERCAATGKRALQLARSRFSRDASARRLGGVFDGLLGASAAAGTGRSAG